MSAPGMPQKTRVYRTSPWVLGIVVAGLAISVGGMLLLASERGVSLGSMVLGGLAVLFAAGVADCLTSRVVLSPESLEIVTNFKRTAVPRAEIIRVVGQKGVPVAVELRSGGWLKLPSLGTGPHPSTIRAWLKRAGS